MKAAFRVDASLQIGTGHVMRCLTLAGALRSAGFESAFICREHPGHLAARISESGFCVHLLPPPATSAPQGWLGASQEEDAPDSTAALARIGDVDLLVVDHYAIDASWQRKLRGHVGRILVIDDLADRPHACDLLLDHTLGRSESDYGGLVPPDCRLLVGPRYCLLRPEFAALRPHSLQRRQLPALKNLLVTMGGVDARGATLTVLAALDACKFEDPITITVVMGKTAPDLEEVNRRSRTMRWPTRVIVDTRDLARLMADADAVIGAGGTTAWERCCLGVPSIMAVLAANQEEVVANLANAGAALHLDLDLLRAQGPSVLAAQLESLQERLAPMSAAAAAVTDGLGAGRLVDIIRSTFGQQ